MDFGTIVAVMGLTPLLLLIILAAKKIPLRALFEPPVQPLGAAGRIILFSILAAAAVIHLTLGVTLAGQQLPTFMSLAITIYVWAAGISVLVAKPRAPVSEKG